MQEEDKIAPIASLPQLREDLPLQRIAWRIQKVCWVGIVMIMIFIALGLFGEGPLSKVRKTRGSTTLEYERFARDEGKMETVVRLKAGATPAEVRIPLNYLARFKIDKVFPETFESKISGNALVYFFEPEKSASLNIQFFLVPQDPGPVKGNWSVNEVTFELSQFIYP